VQTGVTTVTFGAGSSTSDIVNNGNSLSFTKSGVYLIQYEFAIDISSTPAVGSVSLTLNGVPISGSTTTINGSDWTYSGQAIVTVPAGGLVSLTSSVAETVGFASITATRISC
jgi:hypothetical protein